MCTQRKTSTCTFGTKLEEDRIKWAMDGEDFLRESNA